MGRAEITKRHSSPAPRPPQFYISPRRPGTRCPGLTAKSSPVLSPAGSPDLSEPGIIRAEEDYWDEGEIRSCRYRCWNLSRHGVAKRTRFVLQTSVRSHYPRGLGKPSFRVWCVGVIDILEGVFSLMAEQLSGRGQNRYYLFCLQAVQKDPSRAMRIAHNTKSIDTVISVG